MNQYQLELFRKMYTIRRFEETILAEFPKGVFTGTTHTYLGQEANAVGVLSHLDENDLVFSNHRCHGHYLAYGGDMRALFAELMGKPTGICGGIGGSQHIHFRNFFSSGILGGMTPISVGTALAEKRKRSGAITIVFLGDGGLGEGIVYEAFNMASLWRAPILFVIENNHIAQTTPTSKALAGSIKARLESFDLTTYEMDTSDVEEISEYSKALVEEVRNQMEPRGLVLGTERFGPHSKGDDDRPAELIEKLKTHRDPIKIIANRLEGNYLASIESQVEDSVRLAFEQALVDPSI